MGSLLSSMAVFVPCDRKLQRAYYDADKNNKTDKRIQRKREKLAYAACPSYALKVTSDQIYSFCFDLKANSDKSKPMLVDVLEGNDYEPVIVEDLENKFTKCLVAMDHDYLSGNSGKYTNGSGTSFTL